MVPSPQAVCGWASYLHLAASAHDTKGKEDKPQTEDKSASELLCLLASKPCEIPFQMRVLMKTLGAELAEDLTAHRPVSMLLCQDIGMRIEKKEVDLLEGQNDG